ncbi:hypothetical protein ACU5AX_16305 [Sphingomonas sp. XXL09]|uniref:hypothetical protein n=1 Tax=Sphingomonas sp. XXL09 TaxID=3457787 RepID=UPI00406BA40F
MIVLSLVAIFSGETSKLGAERMGKAEQAIFAKLYQGEVGKEFRSPPDPRKLYLSWRGQPGPVEKAPTRRLQSLIAELPFVGPVERRTVCKKDICEIMVAAPRTSIPNVGKDPVGRFYEEAANRIRGFAQTRGMENAILFGADRDRDNIGILGFAFAKGKDLE